MPNDKERFRERQGTLGFFAASPESPSESLLRKLDLWEHEIDAHVLEDSSRIFQIDELAEGVYALKPEFRRALLDMYLDVSPFHQKLAERCIAAVGPNWDGSEVELTEEDREGIARLPQLKRPLEDQRRAEFEVVRHYALRNLPTFLIGCRDWEQLLDRALLDPTFLESKARAGMIQGLARDFKYALEAMPPDHPRLHIVQVLHEAIERHLGFLEAHPEILFQQLWNHAWWYDCPQAEDYHAKPEDGQEPSMLPWRMNREKVSALLQNWRDAREKGQSWTPWIEAMCPYDSNLNRVAFSPDGCLLALI